MSELLFSLRITKNWKWESPYERKFELEPNKQ